VHTCFCRPRLPGQPQPHSRTEHYRHPRSPGETIFCISKPTLHLAQLLHYLIALICLACWYYSAASCISLTPLSLVQIVLMGLIESYRANGGIGDDLGLDRLYPGGDYFDPLGLADDPDSFAELRVNTVSWRHIACKKSLSL